MMRIAVVSCDRLPTKVDSVGGLGKSAHDVAVGLAERGNRVTLIAAGGSLFERGAVLAYRTWRSLPKAFDEALIDVVFDYSHSKELTGLDADLPVLNVIGDKECKYQPPNAVVASKYMNWQYPQAKLIRTPIRADDIPFVKHPVGNYLVFMGLLTGHKGYLKAVSLAGQVDKKLLLMGQNPDNFTPAGMHSHLGVLSGRQKWGILGNADALIAPYTIDASPRVPLEAAACGTPTICLVGDGTQEHIEDNLTGFVCKDLDEMVERVEEAEDLDRSVVRGWVEAAHNFNDRIAEYEAALVEVASGGRW